MTALPSLCRWQQSAKSSGLASNLQPSGAKADALREEMEEAANRVEICRVLGGPGGSLGRGDLDIPGTIENLQPFLLPRSSPSSYPIACDKHSSGWSPCPNAAWWQWVMLTSQAGRPQFPYPHPPYPAGAGEHPVPREPILAEASKLSTK